MSVRFLQRPRKVIITRIPLTSPKDISAPQNSRNFMTPCAIRANFAIVANHAARRSFFSMSSVCIGFDAEERGPNSTFVGIAIPRRLVLFKPAFEDISSDFKNTLRHAVQFHCLAASLHEAKARSSGERPRAFANQARTIVRSRMQASLFPHLNAASNDAIPAIFQVRCRSR